MSEPMIRALIQEAWREVGTVSELTIIPCLVLLWLLGMAICGVFS
jgi:hypothetical protein